uniref:Outer kinetochore protein DAM1 n=1 Tax=Spongospora subterranea TaxID=70186 RepID=A0A0H5RP97_9EUKA|eukprot:CRZ10539.1 hypothetical protein [Spongospora subterranea]
MMPIHRQDRLMAKRLTNFSKAATGVKNATEHLCIHLPTLNNVYENLCAFNFSFANFLDALDLHASSMAFYPEPSRASTKREIVPPQSSFLRTEDVVVNLPPSQNTASPALNVPLKPLVLHSRKLLMLPPKYRGAGERRCLENLLHYLQEAYPDGLCLSEIANSTSLTAIQAKEYVAVLVKLGHVTRIKTKKGLTYIIKTDISS